MCMQIYPMPRLLGQWSLLHFTCCWTECVGVDELNAWHAWHMCDGAAAATAAAPESEWENDGEKWNACAETHKHDWPSWLKWTNGETAEHLLILHSGIVTSATRRQFARHGPAEFYLNYAAKTKLQYYSSFFSPLQIACYFVVVPLFCFFNASLNTFYDEFIQWSHE